MADVSLYTALLHLQEPWYISRLDVNIRGEEVHVFISERPGPLPCSTCGEACPVEDHVEERVWRHLDLRQAKTFIHAHLPRTRCTMHGVLRVSIPWAEPKSRFTREFEAQVIACIHACETVEGARTLMRITWDEARGIMERAVERGLARRASEEVAYLGVDEKSIRKGHRYVTVLTDLDGRRILEVSAGRTKASLIECLERLNSRQIRAVKALSMDMWEPYRLGVEEHFGVPVPDIVHDRYHIISHANNALNDVRKEEVRELTAEGRKDLKGMRRAILFGAENVPERYEPSIARMKASDLRTARGYALKENLRRCWHHRLTRTARQHFRSWVRWAKRSGLEPFQKVANMITKHLRNIITYFKHYISTGPQEAMNAKLMSVIRSARGYKSEATFRMAALFFLGRLELDPR